MKVTTPSKIALNSLEASYTTSPSQAWSFSGLIQSSPDQEYLGNNLVVVFAELHCLSKATSVTLYHLQSHSMNSVTGTYVLYLCSHPVRREPGTTALVVLCFCTKINHSKSTVCHAKLLLQNLGLFWSTSHTYCCHSLVCNQASRQGRGGRIFIFCRGEGRAWEQG